MCRTILGSTTTNGPRRLASFRLPVTSCVRQAGDTAGVLALFSEQKITSEDDAQLDTLSNMTALIIQADRINEDLRASNRIIEGIINSIPLRVFWKDKDLVFLGCNTTFAHDAGFADAKDIIGKDDYIHAMAGPGRIISGG